MGIKERHERERESVRRAILDAARDLFVRDGYQHVSLRKIADRIEYSPAAIYSYFPSKDDIFFALAEEGFQLLYETAHAAPTSSDPVACIKAVGWALYEFSTNHPEHFALMFVDRSVPRIRAHYENFRRLNEMKENMAGLFQRCIDEGRLPSTVDPRAAVRLLATTVMGAAMTRLCHRLGPGENPDELTHDIIELMMAGLQSGVGTTFRASSLACDAGGADPGETTAARTSPDAPLAGHSKE